MLMFNFISLCVFTYFFVNIRNMLLFGEVTWNDICQVSSSLFPVTFEYCWLMQLSVIYYNHNVFSYWYLLGSLAVSHTRRSDEDRNTTGRVGYSFCSIFSWTPQQEHTFDLFIMLLKTVDKQTHFILYSKYNNTSLLTGQSWHKSEIISMGSLR